MVYYVVPTEQTPQDQFLDNIDDDETRSIVRRCLIPPDRLLLREEMGRGTTFSAQYVKNSRRIKTSCPLPLIQAGVTDEVTEESDV